jgi:hypothetical protein
MPTINQSPALYFTYREDNRTFEESGMWDTASITVTPAARAAWVDPAEALRREV